jgi:Ca2+-binding EF-hand superfamily protein
VAADQPAKTDSQDQGDVAANALVEQPDTRVAAEPGERFLLLTPRAPLVVEVLITIDGQRLSSARQRLTAELLKMGDSDGDGQPTWEEAFEHDQFARLEANLTAAENDMERDRRRRAFDRNGDGLLDENEAARFVEQIAGGGSGSVGLQSSSMQDSATDRSRLRELLDADGDRTLSAEEWSSAAARLKLYDIDNNELLSMPELSGELLADPGDAMRVRPGSESISPRALQLGPRANWASIMFSLEELYLVDGRLRRESFGPLAALYDHLDLDGDDRLSRTELERLNSAKSHVQIDVPFGRTGQLASSPSIRSVAAELAGESSVTPGLGGFVDLAGLKLQLASSDSTPQSNFEMTAQRAINDLDKDRNGYFDAEEFASSASENRPRAEFDDVDLDDDGKVYASELEDYLMRQQMPNIDRIQLVVADLEDSFFWALDSNGDGRISPRELHVAPTRLAELDHDGNGQLTRAEIPPLVTLSIDRGDRNAGETPRISRLSVPARTSERPVWFTGMDRNGDGDIGRGEFLGTPEQFERLDVNSDSFVDASEASAFQN